MSTVNHRSVLGLLAVLALCAAPSAGCGPDCSRLTGAVTIALGAGDSMNPTRFTALTDGARVELARGNQGGQHVWVIVRASNACGAPPRVRALLRAEDGSNLSFAISEGIPWSYAPDNQLATEPLALPVRYDHLCRAYYRGGTLEVTLTDSTGRMAQQSVALRSIAFADWTPDAECTAMWGPSSDAGAGAADAGDASASGDGAARD